jgi:hypothetical protein
LAILVLVPVILGIFIYRKRLGRGETTNENNETTQGRTISVSAEEVIMDAVQQPTVRVPPNNEQQAVYIPQDNLMAAALTVKDQCRENPAAPQPLAAAVVLVDQGDDDAKPKAKPRYSRPDP